MENGIAVKGNGELDVYGMELREGAKAADLLKASMDRKTKKIFFNGKEYAEFHDLQVVSNYFGHSIRTHDAVAIEVNGVKGFKAHADLINKDGICIGGAEAYCLQDEPNWARKPLFQLASMAQTRAASKCITNVYRWVLDLAGYGTTPAEEMGDEPKSFQKAPQTAPVNATKTMPPKGPSQPLESIFDVPKQFTTKQGKPFWKTMDGQGNTYYVFDAVIADYMTKKAGNMMLADIEYTPKGNRVVGFREIPIAEGSASDVPF